MSAMTAIKLHGFDVGTSLEQIRAHCASAGKVTSVDFKGKFSAVVQYASEAQARRAVEQLQASFIEGNERYIKVTLKSKSDAGANASGSSVAEKVARRGFAAAGFGVGKGGVSNGAARMALPSSAPSALPVARGGMPSSATDVGGPSPTAVKVIGFDFGTTEQAIRKHLSRVGKVLSVEFMGAKGGNARVTFSSSVAAMKAVEQLSNSVIHGNSRFIEIKPSSKTQAVSNQQVVPARALPVKTQTQPSSAGDLGRSATSNAVKIRPSQKPSSVAPRPQAVSRLTSVAPAPVAASRMVPRTSPASMVHIHGFDFGTTEQAVRKHCSRAGKVVSVELKGTNGGSAVVAYASSTAALKAVETLSGTVIDGNTRYIDVKIKKGCKQPMPPVSNNVSTLPPWQKKALSMTPPRATFTGTPLRPLKTFKAAQLAAARIGAQGGISGARVQVFGFDYGTSEEEVRKHCSKVGKVLAVELKGAGGGNAMVTYASSAAAQKAVDRLNDSVIDGNTRFIRVKLKGSRQQPSSGTSVPEAQPPKKRKRGQIYETPSARRVLIRGFDKETPLDAIVEHCSSAGDIVESRMTKNFAFMTYSSEEEAQAAVDSLDKSTIDGNTRYIDVKIDEGSKRVEDEPSSKAKKARVAETKEKGPSGPDLSREVITGDVVTGTVVRYSVKGNFGFIKPDEEIDHPAARANGELYVHAQDVLGDELLEKDAAVQFVAYVDASGLGAQDVVPLC